ncbi:Hypothetical predicted protein, partial [Paramuricea clavata]
MNGWNLEETVAHLRKEAVEPTISLGTRISEMRQKRKDEKKAVDVEEEKEMQATSANYESSESEGPDFDDDDDDEVDKNSSRKKPKKDDFFEEGPTQFSDLKFTDMNLSRPILK